MKRFDPNAKYRDVDFWVRKDGEYFTLGVTDFGQEFFRDLLSVELPEKGDLIKKDEIFCSVESDKATTDLIAPISGVVAEINLELEKNADFINKHPYSKGWILKLKNASEEEFDDLDDCKTYQENIGLFFNK